MYCNLQTKKIIFGNQQIITGRVEQFVPIALSVFLMLSLLIFLILPGIDIAKLLIFVIIVFICFISAIRLDLVDKTLGLSSQPKTWILWHLLGIALLYSIGIINF